VHSYRARMANICPARHAVAFVDGRAQGPVGGTICVYSNTNVNTHQTHQTHQCAEVAISATTCAGPAIWPIASTTSVSSDPGSGGASSISLLCRADRAMARSCGFLMSLSHHTRFPVTGYSSWPRTPRRHVVAARAHARTERPVRLRGSGQNSPR
jgi:hypothetical protein